jgi:hypothetical protein
MMHRTGHDRAAHGCTFLVSVPPLHCCRRLKPPFKVRVTLWHSCKVDMEATVTAHAITETEFNMLEKWMPPELDAARTGEMVERATPTELKGSTKLSHVFSLVRSLLLPASLPASEQFAVLCTLCWCCCARGGRLPHACTSPPCKRKQW